jgi:hypothetical protein
MKTFVQSILPGKSRITFCAILNQNTNIIDVGISVCAKKYIYKKKFGNAIAYDRAVINPVFSFRRDSNIKFHRNVNNVIQELLARINPSILLEAIAHKDSEGTIVEKVIRDTRRLTLNRFVEDITQEQLVQPEQPRQLIKLEAEEAA